MKSIDHFFLIPDGDRRYAMRTGITLEEAYMQAAIVLLKLIKWVLVDHDIREFSFFGLSYANVVRRSREDVGPIFEQQAAFLGKVPDIQMFEKHGIRLKVCGCTELLPVDYQAAVFKAEEATREFSNKTCNLLLAYSGKKDLEEAIKKTCDARKEPTLENIEKYLLIRTPIDLVVRTANEQRLSDSPLLPTAYSEFHTIDKYFPELEKKDIDEAIDGFNKRVRTYGQ